MNKNIKEEILEGFRKFLIENSDGTRTRQVIQAIQILNNDKK